LKIAVVILNWNGVKLLEQFFTIVIQFSLEADIYVLITHLPILRPFVQFSSHFPTVKIVATMLVLQGYNEALQHIDADIYA
jgi:hypothetical protein